MSNLIAEIKLANGEVINLELFPEHAPMTVANFVNLANRGFYDGLSFHRVIPDFMIQGGCPEGSGRGGPGYRFDDEFVRGLRHEKGTLSMANAGPGTNGSQFFITHVATPWLDGKHTIFGRVVAESDQRIVDQVKPGAKIQAIKIVGDYGPLFEKQRAQLDEWNRVLDRNARP